MTEDEVLAIMVDVRRGCWCEQNRKPCQYHEGYEDGLLHTTEDVEQPTLVIVTEHDTHGIWPDGSIGPTS